jgi:hypothetical protein
MKMRLKILLSTGLILLVISFVWRANSNHAQQARNPSAPQSREDPTSLRARVKRAKPDGRGEVVFSLPEPILADVASLDQALNNYSAIIAEPLEATSVQTDARNIMTYYRFRVLERLSQSHSAAATMPNIPQELPALKENEMYVVEGGGSVLIDGIKVTQRPAYDYALGHKYLLFISTNSSQTVGMVHLGKTGVFRMMPDDDSLEPISGEPSVVSRDLQQRHANRISSLRSALRRM